MFIEFLLILEIKPLAPRNCHGHFSWHFFSHFLLWSPNYYLINKNQIRGRTAATELGDVLLLYHNCDMRRITMWILSYHDDMSSKVMSFSELPNSTCLFPLSHYTQSQVPLVSPTVCPNIDFEVFVENILCSPGIYEVLFSIFQNINIQTWNNNLEILLYYFKIIYQPCVPKQWFFFL